MRCAARNAHTFVHELGGVELFANVLQRFRQSHVVVQTICQVIFQVAVIERGYFVSPFRLGVHLN